jgi:hypothetical protein
MSSCLTAQQFDTKEDNMRYLCYGVAAVEREDNSTLSSGSQNVDTAAIVYVTDDREEALVIMREGGYINSSGTWIVVTKVVDTALVSDPLGAPRRPLGAGDEPPQNSSATVDDAGNVKTDPNKLPETREDVLQQAEWPGSQYNETPRKIIP